MFPNTVLSTPNTNIFINSPSETSTKYFCEECQHLTNHTTLSSITKRNDCLTGDESLDNQIITYTTYYETIHCLGCNTCSFIKRCYNSEIGYPEEQETTNRYPELTSKRKPFDGLDLVPVDIQRIYQETYLALINGYSILTGIGIRGIIESACREHKVKGKNLEEKINALAKINGTITDEAKTVLHQLRFLGNNAAHEGVAHSYDELNAALEIVDHILQALFVIPKRITSLRQKIPNQDVERTLQSGSTEN